MDGVNPAHDDRVELERLKAFIRACLRLRVDADDVAINAAIAVRGGASLSRYETHEMRMCSRSH
jgi:hypothetical protein